MQYSSILKTAETRGSYAKFFYQISTLFSSGTNGGSNGIGTQKLKIQKGIMEHLSGKKGVIKNNILGKRTNHAGRSVIGPNPNLPLDCVEIPRCMKLTFPETVTSFIKERLLQKIASGKVTRIEKVDRTINVFAILETKPEALEEYTKLEDGDVVHRFLQNGNIVIINRQPTLHSASMQAMRVVLGDKKTMRFSLSLINGLNADFDGGEANIYVPQSLETAAEAWELARPSVKIFSKATGKPIISLVQDTIQFRKQDIFLMTDHAFDLISRELFFDYVSRIGFLRSKTVFDPVERMSGTYNGRELFSILLPEWLSLEAKDVQEIKRGKLLKGSVDGSVFDEIVF